MNNDSDFNKSKKLALKYLARKPRSVKEIEIYLTQKCFDKTAIENTLEYLENLDYLNDKKLALSYAEHRKNFKKEGKLRIENELIRRGISSENASQALIALFQENEELNLAKLFAEKFLSQMSSQEPEKFKKKLIHKLKRKGYCDSIVLTVIKSLPNRIQHSQF
jgi:regulatory protein